METIKATSETIACTLTEGEHDDVRSAWEDLFRTSLVTRDLFPGGLKLTVIKDAEQELRRLVEIESVCCSWITFVIDGPSVTMTAPADGEQAIREMWVGDSAQKY